MKGTIWIFKNHSRCLSRQLSRSMLCPRVLHPAGSVQGAGVPRCGGREQVAVGGPHRALLPQACPGALLSPELSSQPPCGGAGRSHLASQVKMQTHFPVETLSSLVLGSVLQRQNPLWPGLTCYGQRGKSATVCNYILRKCIPSSAFK